jgi:phosphoadenosine phosphosulfate reductase
MMSPSAIKDVLDRHKRIAFQFSGGKDSTAALLAMRTEWHRIAVYFLDAGDLLQETYDFVQSIAKDIPDFRVIKSDSKAVRAQLGHPSDLVATGRTYAASILSGAPFVQVDTHTCCYNSIMKPMHDRMVEDGITLIIRGQKLADDLKGRLVSGDVLNGVEYLFPIEHMTDSEVMDCLENIQLPAYYRHMTNAPDCKSCTGWWKDGRMSYLAKSHPELAKDYAGALIVFRGELAKHMNELDAELQTYMRELG